VHGINSGAKLISKKAPDMTTAGRKEISENVRQQIIGFLTGQLTHKGTFKYGTVVDAATLYGCHENTIRLIWKRNLAPSKTSARGSKSRKFVIDEVDQKLKAVPLRQRQTVRSAAAAIEMSPSTLQDMIGPLAPIRRATVRLKPALTSAHKTERLAYVLDALETPYGA
jgi:transposase-like protein